MASTTAHAFANDASLRGVGTKRAQAAIPILCLAYPLLIQPLLEFRSNVSDAGLDLDINARNAEANPLNQIFWIAVALVTVMLFRHEWVRARRMLAIPAVLLVLAYLLLAAASVGWSPAPEIALRRLGLQLIVVLLMVGTTHLALYRSLVLRGWAWLCAGAVAINLPLALLLPGGRMGGALGIYSNKNILGLVMALSATVILYRAKTAPGRVERGLLLLLAAGAVVTLIFSDAETSILLAIIAPGLAWAIVALSRMVHVKLFPVTVALALWFAAMLSLYFAFGGTRDLLLGTLVGDSTFSGRTSIWDFVLVAASDKILLGTGYASFWGVGQNSYVAESAPGFISGLLQSHNGYFDILLETGALGLGLMFAIIIAAMRTLDIGTPDVNRGLKMLLLAIMLFATFHNLLESSWFRSFSIVWLFFLMALGVALPNMEERR